MLKSDGFSLFEMLLVLTLSSAVLISMMKFFSTMQHSLIYEYQRQRLQQLVNSALIPLIKDLKRAGFIANALYVIQDKAIEINLNGNCVIIRYDLNRSGKWEDQQNHTNFAERFVYRYHKNNIEFSSGAISCIGQGWEKLFDQNEIKISEFKIVDHHTYAQLLVNAYRKNMPSISYRIDRVIGYENR